MNKKIKLILLGLMIWAVKFMVGGAIFATAGEEGPLIDVGWIYGIQAFFVTLALVLALFLLYRNKEQDYKRTALEAGVVWYAMILLIDLIVLVGFLGLELDLWFPSILLEFKVLIIPIVVGYLLAGLKIKKDTS